mgnify:CR=1 FL=1
MSDTPKCVLNHNKQNSWWLNDAQRIPLRRICDDCADYWLGYYSPEVLGIRGSYTDVVEEQIDEDY